MSVIGQAVGAKDDQYSSEFNYVPLADVELLNLPQSSQGLGSFSRDRNALGGVGYSERKFEAIKDHIQTIRVETIPISEVLRTYGEANLVVTDCEGHDVELISAALECPQFNPTILYFEDLGHDPIQFRNVTAQLAERGYLISKTGKNIVGWQREASA